MNLRDFRIGWRLLVREPAYSAVVVLGLALGFAACFLLLAFTRYSLDYDAQLPEVQQVYTIKSHFNVVPEASRMWMEMAPYGLARAARDSGLPVSAVALTRATVVMRVGAQIHKVELTLTEPDFATVFRLRASAGDLQAALSRPDALALTRALATQLFGADAGAALGRSVQIQGRPYLVAALLDDPPANTTVPYAAMAGLNSTAWPDISYQRAVYDDDNWPNLYFRLGAGVTPQALTQVLQEASDRAHPLAALPARMRDAVGDQKFTDLRLGGLRDAYLDPEVRNSFGSGPRGDRGQVLGLAAVALLVLLLAATNYVNLATVRTLRRRREIGVRKILGAGAARVAGQFMAESLLVALLATSLGLLLAYLLLPAFSALVDRDLNGMLTPATLLAALGIGLGVGLLAGVYPVLVALRVRAAVAVSGRGGDETVGGLWLRRGLTALQFATAMGLTGVTLAVAWQTDYAARSGPGFDPAALLVIDLPGQLRSDAKVWNPQHRAFREALLRQSYVAGVGLSDEAIGSKALHFAAYQRDGVATQLVTKQVNAVYFDAYALQPLAGRFYDARRDGADDAHVVVINQTAARLLGFATPQAAIGTLLTADDNRAGWRIIGVAPDIRHQSPRQPPQAALYQLSQWTQVATVRVAGDMAAAQRGIAQLYQQYFPDDVLEMRSAAGVYAQNYAEDRRLMSLLLAATLLAVCIAAFGIYVLAAYNVQRRGREIVLRKLHGAGRADIGRLMGREFLALLLAGAAVGLPLAGWINARYLAGFAEPAPIGPWALLAAFALALLVASLSTLRHGLAAMRIVPALALRD